MSTYVKYNDDKTIAAFADWAAPGMVKFDFEVVRGYDGKLYKKGEEPEPTPEEQAEQRRQEILAELDNIDRASSRSLRAILTAQAAGQEPDKADIEMLSEHEADAKKLRAELVGLNA